MPPRGDDLLRRLLEESVQRLNEEGKGRKEAEEGATAVKLKRNRPRIDEAKNQKSLQFKDDESKEEEEPDVVDISDEDRDEDAEIGSEVEDEIEVSDEEDEDIFINPFYQPDPKEKYEDGEENEVTSDNLIQGLVFNYLKVLVPSLTEEFKDAFTFHGTQLKLEEVITAVNILKEESDTKDKVSREETSCRGYGSEENLAKGLVFNFLKETAPDLAKEFEEAFSFRHTQIKLEKVLEHLKKHTGSPLLAAESRAVKGSSSKVKVVKPGGKKNRSTGCRVRKFTQDEDEVLREVMAKVDKVSPADCRALASRLDRGYRSIQARIESLQINSGVYRRKRFSFTEDCVILDTLILPRLKKEKLSKILLSNCHFEKLAIDLNRKLHSVRHRWEGNLQPTLLQFYAGTLNMQIEKMLANFIADTFHNYKEINWPEVAARPDFAGHTEQSLKNMYFQELLSSTRKKLGIQGDEDNVTLRQVAEHTRDKQRAWRKNKEKWQQALIAFFERRVDQLGIKSFL